MSFLVKLFAPGTAIPTTSSAELKTILSKSCGIPAPSILLKTDAISNIGGYDERFDAEDWPTFLKLTRNNYEFYGIKDSLVLYRVLPSSLGKVESLERMRQISMIFTENKNIMPNNNLPDNRGSWMNVICFFVESRATNLRCKAI